MHFLEILHDSLDFHKMKIVKKNISAKDGSGSIMLRPETPENLWLLVDAGSSPWLSAARCQASCTHFRNINISNNSLLVKVSYLRFYPSPIPDISQATEVRTNANKNFAIFLFRKIHGLTLVPYAELWETPSTNFRDWRN